MNYNQNMLCGINDIWVKQVFQNHNNGFYMKTSCCQNNQNVLWLEVSGHDYIDKPLYNTILFSPNTHQKNWLGMVIMEYHQISNIWHTVTHQIPKPKCFSLSCSCLCPIHWCQVLSREWRCSWSSADGDRRFSNYIWVINNFIAY